MYLRFLTALFLSTLGSADARPFSTPADVASPAEIKAAERRKLEELVAWRPLTEALGRRPSDLRLVEQNDPAARYALALILEHGLRGTPPDLAEAARLKASATATRPATTAIYAPPVTLGGAGSVLLVPTGASWISAETAARIEGCVAVLSKQATVAAPRETNPIDAEATPHPAIAACGGEERHARLSRLWSYASPSAATPKPECLLTDPRCQELARRIERLNARDPVAEATAAVASGDHRLAATQLLHMGHPSPWETPGVACRAWHRHAIRAWHRIYLLGASGQQEHSAAATDFIARYNMAVAEHPDFAWADVCAPEGLGRASRYQGPVVTHSQAARSGDVARLVEARDKVDDVDILDMPALAWAMANRDIPVMLALLARGANPNIRGEYDSYPPPLAWALRERQAELIKTLLARGAKMTGETGLCAREVGYWPQATEEPKAGGVCTWAGLLVANERFDLLDAAAGNSSEQQGANDAGLGSAPESPPFAIDGRGELFANLIPALERRDRRMIERLLPHVGHGGQERLVIDELVHHARMDLVRDYVVLRGSRAASSKAEQQLWLAAARARRTEALGFLIDHGRSVGFVTPARLAECEVAATRSDLSALLSCVREGASARRQLLEAIATGEGVTERLRAIADPAGRDSLELTVAAVRAGDPAALAVLLARGTETGDVRRFVSPPFRVAAGNYRATPGESLRWAQAYSGRYAAEASALAPAPWEWRDPVMLAATRSDAASLKTLVDAGARNLAARATALVRIDPSPGFNLMMEPGSSTGLPDAPAPDAMRAIDLLVTEAARTEGAQALEPVALAAVSLGADRVLELVVARGFRLAAAQKPERLWSAWTGLGNPCKPSTGRILLREGLPLTFTMDPDYSIWPPLSGLAAGCRDVASAKVLVDGGAAVNAIDARGDTAVDLARRYGQRRAFMADAIIRLGGKPAAEVDPAGFARRRAEEMANEDPDLAQERELLDEM
jgi:hypothetical protein